MEEGGVERYLVTLNGLLRRANWENTVVSAGGKLEAEILREGGRTRSLDLKSKNPLTALGRAWRLRRMIAAEKPDVVVAHSRVPAWLFKLAYPSAKDRSFRYLTYAHGANSVSWYSRIMTSGEAVMCPSNFIKDYLMKAYGTAAEKFRVVPHGVDGARFDLAKIDRDFVAEKRREWGIEEDERVVMSIGRITPLKGFDTLISAAAHFPPKTCLVLVGGADADKEAYFTSLKNLARQSAAKIVFAGYQSCTAQCLSLAEVVVSANSRKPESFGLSMVEALAMGRRVVAKAFGGALDIVRDGLDGRLVKEGTPEEFAAAIKELLSTPLSQECARAIRESALSRFSLSAMSEQTLKVYSEKG